MGIRDRYETGVFSWADLSTTNPESAKSFYSNLLGWTFQDVPTDTGMPYSMAFKNEKKVAALFEMPSQLQSKHIPPHWQCYITTHDIENTLNSTQAAGGSVIMSPIEVMDSGIMAVIQDPTGANVSLWEPKSHIGAELVNEPGCFCWAELQTRGADNAAKFYQQLFGWEIEVDDKPPHYVSCKVKGHLNCGIFDMDRTELPASIPSRWAVYFNVADLDAAMEQTTDRGGKVLMPPIAIAPGRFTTITDPQGATVTLMELENPDD